jgi:class 3 adenylate cyclase
LRQKRERSVDDTAGSSSTGRQSPPGTPRAQERRVVTTLICDLVGFTALSERHDAERIDSFLRRYYEVARRAVESYGGVVERFIGDAVVAVFGVPTVHEDDPERGRRPSCKAPPTLKMRPRAWRPTSRAWPPYNRLLLACHRATAL